MKTNNLPFIVFEGMCCSGKTTAIADFNTFLQAKGTVGTFCNKGVFTKTEIGRSFSANLGKMSIGFSTVFYLADLLQDTISNIKPALDQGKWVLQDRYIGSIAAYRKAYGQYKEEYLDFSAAVEIYYKNKLLLRPRLEVYCIPPLETLVERMQVARENAIHQYYLGNPEFMRLVYDATKEAALANPNAIVLDTSKKLNEVDFELLFNNITKNLA